MTSPVAPPTMTGAPTAPDRSDRPTFSGRATAWADFQKETLVPEIQAAINNAFTNATSAHESAQTADTKATAADASATAASASASAAAAAAGAVAWVSGNTYATGDRRWSLINQQLYRRTSPGAGAIDPANDSANWARIWIEPEMVTAESFFLASF